MKPILFIDFYKTLNHERYWRSLPTELDLKLQREYFGKDEPNIIDDWMVGKYTAREVNKIISEKLNIPFDYLWEIFLKDCDMVVPEETLQKISLLRGKFIVILLTVNTDSFSEFTSPALEKYFDYISNSFYERKHKNDDGGAIFLEYAEKYNSPIQKCFLIDDAASVCRTFRLLGGTAYQVTSEKSADYYLDVLNTI